MTLAEYLAQVAADEAESDDDTSSSAMLRDVSGAEDDEENSEPSPRKQAGPSARKNGADALIPREAVAIKGDDKALDTRCRLVVKTPVDYPPWEKFQRYRSTDTFFCYQPERGWAFLQRGLEFRCMPFRGELMDCNDPWKLVADKKPDVKRKGKRTSRAATNKSAKQPAQGTRHQPPRASTQFSSARVIET